MPNAPTMYIGWIAIGFATVFGVAPLMLSTSNKQREKALDRYARTVNLAITDEVRPVVVRRIKIVERFTLIGGGVGGLLGLAASLVVRLTGGDDWAAPFVIVLGVTVGLSFAPVGSVVMTSLRTPTGARVARATTPRLTDYVPRLERRAAPIALGCAGLALAGGVISLATGVLTGHGLDAPGVLVSPGAIVAYTAALGYAAALILIPVILASGQPAGSTQELAWDDAMRASSLRSLIQTPLVVALCSVVVTFLDVGSRTINQPDVLAIAGVAALGIFTVAAVALVAAIASTSGSQYYWRQLWQHADPVR